MVVEGEQVDAALPSQSMMSLSASRL